MRQAFGRRALHGERRDVRIEALDQRRDLVVGARRRQRLVCDLRVFVQVEEAPREARKGKTTLLT